MYRFLTSPVGGECLASRAGRCTNCIGGLVGPRTSVDGVEKRVTSSEFELRVVTLRARIESTLQEHVELRDHVHDDT
jgi:hypothetical protein